MKKFLSVFISLSVLFMYLDLSFANEALKQADLATDNASLAFDGAPQLKTNIPVPTPQIDSSNNTTTNSSAPVNTVNAKPAPKPSLTISKSTDTPKELTFGEKVLKDMKANKTNYITVGLAAGLLGFILGGPLGAVIGIAAMTSFVVVQRIKYIDSTYKAE